MLAFDQALKIVLGLARPLAAEQVDLAAAAGRILAEDVTSDIDMPPFDKSTRDGYACRRADLPNVLTIVETIGAGYVPRKRIGANQCAKIMTGAMLPAGADCVIMVEFTANPTEETVRFTGRDTDDNIWRCGDDLKASDTVLHKGDRIAPQHTAVLAAVGCVRPRVSLRPRVGIMVTGSELVAPSQRPDGSKIRDSNSSVLAALVNQVGVVASDYGVVADAPEQISAAVSKAAAENDVILISGGVSMGDYDYVPAIFRQNHFDLLFEKIAVKPGKPTVFGIRNGTYCFGLPGNPVSVFVIFGLFVKPFLYKLMGHDYKPRNLLAKLAEPVRRKHTERLEWLPVLTDSDGTVKLIEYHGSGHISALCQADGLISIDVGAGVTEKGTLVRVRLL